MTVQVLERDTTPGTYSSTGEADLALPTGTVASDYAVLCMGEAESGSPDSHPEGDGWQLIQATYSTTIWVKRLTADDITAGTVPVVGRALMLSTFYRCGGVGNVTAQKGATLSVAGAGLFVFCRGEMTSSALTPLTDKLHASDVVNAAYKNRRYNTWFVAHTTTGYKSLSGTNATYYSGLELLPASAPLPPTLLAPASAANLDPGVANAFRVQHNSLQGAAQSGLDIRVRVVGSGTVEYLQSDGTLGATSSGITTSSSEWSLDAAELTTATDYEWGARTAEDDGGIQVWSEWSGWQTLSAVAPPAVTGVTVTSPAGDLTPTVAFTRTLGVGDQVAHRVRLCPSADSTPANPVWDSGWVAGSALSVSAPADAGWTNGQTLYAWIDIEQTGGLRSASTKDDATCTVSWTPPAAPSGVTIAAGSPPEISVAGVSGRDMLQLQTSPDGTTWTDLATVPVTANPMVVDYALAPYGEERYVRARVSDTVDGVEMWSTWATSALFESTDPAARLVSASDPAVWLAVRIHDRGERAKSQTIDVTRGHGATRARVDYSPDQGWESTNPTILLVADQAEEDAILAFWAAQPVFWVRWNPELEVLTHVLRDRPATRVARVTVPSETAPVKGPYATRLLPFQWVEQ